MTRKEIVILIMGLTGSGKSNFINKLTGTREERGANGLKSCTQGIREFTVDLAGGRHYVFVDSPGFDNDCRSDQDILRTIADWLETRYRNNVKLSGVIYTHRITDNHMSSAACKNLDMLGRMCGERATRNVRLVTTMWDKVKDRQLASSRAAQLEGNLWKPLMDKGARHERFLGNNRASAWEIVRGLTADAEPLLLQEELVDFERRLNETTAGRATNSQFQRLLQEQKETIKQLQEEAKAQKDPALARELQAEYDRIEAQLQKTWDEIEKEKVPLTRRIGLFFFKKTRARKLQMNLPQ